MFFYLTEHQLTGQAAHAAPSFFGEDASEPTQRRTKRARKRRALRPTFVSLIDG